MLCGRPLGGNIYKQWELEGLMLAMLAIEI
jgi:hypothetical protein